MKSTWHRVRRSLFYPCLASVLLVASGCTTVPTKEFATYKETFSQARKAGEDVLLDYGVAAAQYHERSAKGSDAKPKPKVRAEPFEPSSAARNTASVDHIAVRMKAWDVLARYNDLLTALAEGKAADELAGAVDGLSSSLASFPVAEVALTWTEVSGYLAPLKPLALEAVRERSRRQFVAAVGKLAPLMTDKFLNLLREESKDFYRVRWGLNDMDYRPAVDEIAFAGNRFADVAEQFEQTQDVATTLAKLNADLLTLPQKMIGDKSKPEIPKVEPKPSPAGAPAPTADVLAQLESLQADAAARIGRALAKNAELDAYREVLTHYVTLLDQLDQNMRALQIAAEQAQPNIPQGADLERTVILLREAYMKYKDIGKE